MRENANNEGTSAAVTPEETLLAERYFWSEDLVAMVIAGMLLLLSLASVSVTPGQDSAGAEVTTVTSHFAGRFAKPGGWRESVAEAFVSSGEGQPPPWHGIVGSLALATVLFSIGSWLLGQSPRRFLPGFAVLFTLATLAYLLAGHKLIKAWNLEYALWALGVGLLISNTVGTPARWRPALRTEFYIKTGLVLLGAEILFGRLLSLGVPGIFVAWVVTPTVLVTTYWFGQRVLKIPSRSLNMVISADMSVCGVSAAIASAAACRAKKEELSLAIGMSLTFTVIMMAVMPAIIRGVGMDQVLGGAWLGGTIDATGAVAAAGALLGEEALQVAATVKMIQNILIGVVAFFIAVYWVSYVERPRDGSRPGIGEIWVRFPKFVLGFVAASLLFSGIHRFAPEGAAIVDAALGGVTKNFRGWCFCLAFVSIGLETNFRQLASQLRGGKPVLLYVAGQSLNLVLTLLMAYLMFRVVFPHAAAGLDP